MKTETAVKKIVLLKVERRIKDLRNQIKDLKQSITRLENMDYPSKERLFYPFLNIEPDSMGQYHCSPGVNIYDAEDIAQSQANLTGQCVSFVHNDRVFTINPKVT